MYDYSYWSVEPQDTHYISQEQVIANTGECTVGGGGELSVATSEVMSAELQENTQLNVKVVMINYRYSYKTGCGYTLK